MSVKPVAVARKTAGRPSAIDTPEGGWSWVGVSGLAPGDYVLTLDTSDDTVVEVDAEEADAASPGIAKGAEAIARGADRLGAGWERLCNALLRVVDAKLPAADAKEDTPLTAILGAVAPHVPELLSALGPALAKMGLPASEGGK